MSEKTAKRKRTTIKNIVELDKDKLWAIIINERLEPDAIQKLIETANRLGLKGLILSNATVVPLARSVIVVQEKKSEATKPKSLIK